MTPDEFLRLRDVFNISLLFEASRTSLVTALLSFEGRGVDYVLKLPLKYSFVL